MEKSTRNEIQTEALDAIGDLNTAGIAVSMGVGKCLLGLKHMAKNYNDFSRFLVVAPKKTIFESWKDDAEKFGYEGLLNHIDFVTYRSLNKKDFMYDVVYLDECHSLKYNHKDWLNDYLDPNNGKLIGLTGTYPTGNIGEKAEMCNTFCPKVYEYSTDNAVDDGILNDYTIYVHKLYLNAAKEIPVEMKNGKTFMTSEVKDYEYWNQRVHESNTAKQTQIARIQRMKCLQKFPSKEKYASKLLSRVTKKTIIFANTQAQADNLCSHSFHSKNKQSDDNLKLFKNGDILALSAVEQLSEGVTIPNLETGIIMHSYSNNKKASQKIGRLLRLNPEQTSTIHILCYVNSIDKEWVTSALQHLDQTKIKWIDPII
jgi:superfamily II DNA or RNA helicase